MVFQPTLVRVVAASLSLGAAMLATPAWAAGAPAAGAACNEPAFLVLDGRSDQPRQVDRASRTLARELGTRPLFKASPTAVLEGQFAKAILVTLPLACPRQADQVEHRRSWQRLLALTEDSPDRRAMVFAADPAHANPSPAAKGCTGDAWLGFKGLVSDRDRYFAFLRQIGQSKILDRYGATRVVVMNRPGIVVREIGAPFAAGEYFELLRFPCAQRMHDLWNSDEFKTLAQMRQGVVTIKAGTFEAR